MTGINEVVNLSESSLSNLWDRVGHFLPQLVVAVVVFIIGWIIAVIVGKIAWHIVKAVKLDSGLEKIGFKEVWERSGHKLDTPMFFYELVKWFFVIVFLMTSTEILGLTQVTEFLRSVVNYLPNVFIASIVLLIGVLVATFAEKLVRASVRAAQLSSANALAALSRWAILVFALLIALSQLEVGKQIVDTAAMGIIVAGALAFGLAFGLGGKSHAEEVIAKMRKHVND